MSVWQGKRLTVEIQGTSHGDGITTTLTGLKKDLNIDERALQEYVDLRKPGSFLSTPRKEDDKVEISRQNGGSDIIATVANKDVKSSDYDFSARIPRPSHADFAAIKKYGDTVDLKGGGKYSGRLTVGLMIAGGIAKQQLEKEGITVKAYLSGVGKTQGISYKTQYDLAVNAQRLSDFPALSDDNKRAFSEEISKASAEKDSVGGRVECVISGIKKSLGDSLFDGFECGLSSLLFAIPGVKGVEFGDGFELSTMHGSEANDQFEINCGEIETKTHHGGGILGGTTYGDSVCFSVAIKPTPSIGKPQQSVDLKEKKNTTLEIKGRHDPCVALRAAYVVDAVANLFVYDLLEEEKDA